MYIMSQDGTRIERLEALEIVVNTDGKSKRILHNSVDGTCATVAVYPTAEAAKAQLLELSRAIMRGVPLYSFDPAQGGK